MRSRFVAMMALLALTAGLLGVVPAQAGHNPDDDHSKNFKQLARKPIKIDKGVFAQGSDLAFKGRLVIAGTYQGPAIFKIVSRGAGYLKQIGFASCPGGQGDVSVLGNYVFFSVDSTLKGPKCSGDDATGATQNQIASDTHWEGLRIFDISDPRRPRWVKSIKTDCGSHTHTLLPGEKTSYVYIESYPLSGQGPGCNAAVHRKTQIIQFPTANPGAAKLLEQTIDTSPAPGCHDITTFPDRDLMVGACINQSMIWSIKDPVKPELLATITNEDMQIHHSTAMTWDGKILVLGDEYAGAAGGGGCTGDEDSTVGAAWFYDISDPANPTLLGHHSLPRVPQHADSKDEVERFRCTNHNFNVIPLKDPKKYWLAVSYYMGGIAVVDFSDPSDPTEIGHYMTNPGGVAQDTWASYWYNGRIYTNDYLSRLGVGVYKFRGTGKRRTYFFKGAMNPQVQFDGNLRK